MIRLPQAKVELPEPRRGGVQRVVLGSGLGHGQRGAAVGAEPGGRAVVGVRGDDLDVLVGGSGRGRVYER